MKRWLLASVTVVSGLLAAPAAQANPRPGSATPPKAYYLALETRWPMATSRQVQQRVSHIDPATFDTGYVDDFASRLARLSPGIQVVNDGCPGETSVSLINGNGPGKSRYRKRVAVWWIRNSLGFQGCHKASWTGGSQEPHLRGDSMTGTIASTRSCLVELRQKLTMMTAIPPDYDSDPERWQSWASPKDVHDMLSQELHGPVLDVGCGEGRLASLLDAAVTWIGLDSSPGQLAANPHRPLLLADMRPLPFRDGVFAEVTHLWCLYHVDDARVVIGESERVLRSGGHYYASTAVCDRPRNHVGGILAFVVRRRGGTEDRRLGVRGGRRGPLGRHVLPADNPRRGPGVLSP